MTQRKKPKVKGWCIVTDSGQRTAYLYDAKPKGHTLAARERAVRMVEADPAAAAELRDLRAVAKAAAKWAKATPEDDPFSEAGHALAEAVEKMQRKGKR